MRLEDLKLSMVTEAVKLYLQLAYRDAEPPPWEPNSDLSSNPEPAEILQLFQTDLADPKKDASACRRFTMRLGNRNYPFMKLLLQEHIVSGEFYFGVDTHDEMDIKPDYPDYEAWMAVRKFNRELKQQIEGEFAAHRLATASNLRDLIAGRECAEITDRSVQGTILVIDDEEDLASAVESLLTARGYAIMTAYDGRRGLDLARETHPDMILLDYELPELDGLEVLEALRARPETQDIPVLLCTASKISVSDIRKADGFLAKPYQESLLYRMVDRVIATTGGKAEP